METIIENLDLITDNFIKEIAGDFDKYPRGITPRETVWEAGNIKLLKFESPSNVDGTPMLVVPSLINRWYILDVTEKTSYIKRLAEKNPVYLIDWGYPGIESGHLPLSHFYHKTIKRAVRQIRRLTGYKQVDMLGYCIGGTLAYAFSCLEPKLIKNLILLTTPIDFSEAGILANYADTFPAKEFLENKDSMTGATLAFSFQFVQPMGSYQKTKMFHNKFESDKFLELYNAMERWISDPVDFPAQAYYELLTDLYKNNLLSKGELVTAEGILVDPSKAEANVLILNATKDHIAPLATTVLPLGNKAKVREISIPSGHIGITTGRNGLTACQNVIDFINN